MLHEGQEPPAPTPAEETLTDANGRHANASPDVIAPHIFVVLECTRIAAGGTRHSLANVDRVTLERYATRSSERMHSDGERTLAIRIPDRRMSAHHACIVREGAPFAIEDHGSRNGTRVNGRTVAGRVPLVDGDIVDAGHTIFLYRAAVATPLGAPADFDSTVIEPTVALATLDASLARSAVQLSRVAASKVPILILGETGTGKELMARAVHRLSGRKGALVAVNCGALPATLIEAQLFGHVRGAFSGATGDAVGLLRSADGGTLFLDEIGDLPAPSQAALLRALQEGEIVPVGGVRAIHVDLRVVAATHRPLDAVVARGEFRSDLYARIAGLTFHLPPLRDRREDIGVILATISERRPLECTPDVGRALVRCDWPLNVRELRHALDVAVALADGETLALAHLPPAVARAAAALPIGADPVQEKLIDALARHRGNVSEVARELGTARMQVQRWMRRLGIAAASFRR
ncbi:MAG: sigma 54-interacting transcriptional regulator [Polyangiaceae bacterium]